VKITVAGQSYTVGGDIVLKIDGIVPATVADLHRVREQMGRLPSGQTYGMTVLRGGWVIELVGRVP
jgi:hypothetical protein